MFTASLLPQLHVAVAGLLFQLTVIVGIGPQNIVLLKQGVRRWGIGLVVSVFILGDIVLLTLGTAGVSMVVEKMPLLLEILRWGGVGYLLWFASTCLRDVRDPTPIETSTEQPAAGPRAGGTGTDAGPGTVPDGMVVHPTVPDGESPATGTAPVTTLTRTRVPLRTRATTRMPSLVALPTALAVTFLNPAAWIDGTIVFGSMANQYGDSGKWVFTAGALVGSTLFFVGVGYAARLLARPLSSVRVWRWINLGIGLLMVAMAARLAMMG